MLCMACTSVHDSPGAGSRELQLLVVSQSQQTDSGTSEEPVSQMKWKTSVYPVGTWSIKNKNPTCKLTVVLIDSLVLF